jgi:hypothetical protein
VHCEDNYGLRLKSGSDFEEKNLQVPEDHSEILPGTTEDHVDGITLSNFEIAGGINV